jgi:dihydrofolate synthase/folylpolyglutamate synthase
MAFMPHWPISPIRGNIQYDLDRILIILEKLGNPHKNLPPVIHVAGTNGKGSTLAFLQSIFSAAGYSVHKYTSPHFLHFNERIIINGQMIEDGYLYSLLEYVRQVCENNNIIPTFFEATTAAAFLAFSQNKADILLLETGMGGRLDATNVIDSPLLTIITSISLDHMEYLGPTLKLIAGEKAGIIKTGVTCIITDQIEEVLEVLFDVCARKNALSFALGYDFSIEKYVDGFKYQQQGLELDLPFPVLPGDHQLLNASNAIAAILQLRDKYNITTEHIIKGLLSTNWKGRLEKLTSGALCKYYPNFEFWIDGAHNEGGARMLRIWLEDNHSDREIFLIVGFTKGRNVPNLLSKFSHIAKKIYGVRVQSEPLSYTLEALEEEALNVPDINFCTADGVIEVCAEIAKISTNKTPLILITGSLFLLSDVYKL